MTSEFNKMDLDELQSYFSDFHKDFYGFRPRFATPEQWVNRDWLTERIEIIHGCMDKMKETVDGRMELRENGWVIEEFYEQDMMLVHGVKV
jgi:hypothetical protein